MQFWGREEHTDWVTGLRQPTVILAGREEHTDWIRRLRHTNEPQTHLCSGLETRRASATLRAVRHETDVLMTRNTGRRRRLHVADDVHH